MLGPQSLNRTTFQESGISFRRRSGPLARQLVSQPQMVAGAWHSPDRYPLYPPSAEIVIITSHDTQHELETQDRARWQLTQVVDYHAERGLTFDFEL